MKLLALQKSDQNEAVLDPWSAVHVSAGLAAGLLGIPLLWSIAGAVLYEVAENRFETTKEGLSFFNVSGPESLENQVVDVAVFAIGAWLGQKYNQS